MKFLITAIAAAFMLMSAPSFAASHAGGKMDEKKVDCTKKENEKDKACEKKADKTDKKAEAHSDKK